MKLLKQLCYLFFNSKINILLWIAGLRKPILLEFLLIIQENELWKRSSHSFQSIISNNPYRNMTHHSSSFFSWLLLYFAFFHFQQQPSEQCLSRSEVITCKSNGDPTVGSLHFCCDSQLAGKVDNELPPTSSCNNALQFLFPSLRFPEIAPRPPLRCNCSFFIISFKLLS